MGNNTQKILVLFVEPMLYIMDLIHDVYEKTPYEFQFIFCHGRLTGKDDLKLPEGTVVCYGTQKERKAQIKETFARFCPDFAVINGYVGTEQTAAICCSRKMRIPYAIETDTPLHIPGNRMKAVAKKLYLIYMLHHPLCYGFPGGTLQKENLVYYGIPEAKCFTMPMCVSTQRMQKAADCLPDKDEIKARHTLAGKDVFLFVGRLEKVKNVPVLLYAFKDYKNDNPNAALVLVGDGKEARSLKQLAEYAGIQDVYFEGYIRFPELAEYYKMADVFVLPSCYEPWGLVVNEAQAFDLPVIVSSRVGSRKDLIVDGETGFIFEDNNAAMLRDAMEKARALKRPKVRMAEKWNHTIYFEQFVKAVERICREKKEYQLMP